MIAILLVAMRARWNLIAAGKHLGGSLVISTVIALGVGSCITPSIPIPPPDAEQMQFAVDVTGGTAQFSYSAEPIYANAVVYVFNRDTNAGVITVATPNGAVAPTAPFAATLGDRITVTFEQDAQSVATCIRLQQGVQSSLVGC